QVYVLDTNRCLCPVGVSGELYIGGSGVARGYLRRDELTLSRFVSNPFGEGRLYRTGDIGRWNLDGVLEFHGRLDNQVKLRGYRIELEEIERAMDGCPGVESSVVMIRGEEDSHYLAGYYTGEADEDELRACLGSGLPSYMVPTYLLRVKQFKLTVNGKLDKGTLPDPVELGAGQSQEYEAART
ncbi:non-ribosomal peptide synthetase, partial [Mucilaginibacter sp. RCC_168]